ncbi:FCD domain-containing protein [Ferrovibrio terrae]|uniref:GntR family transcriptional regulator n=1 Tax=Ferrovibrio terrae TaxID=2594003 RepID=UPI003137A21A
MVQAAAKSPAVKSPAVKPASGKAAPSRASGRKITAAEAMAVPRLPQTGGKSGPGRKAGAGGSRATIDDATIYDSVYTAIVDHIIMPGTKLPEDVLAKAFGVSRTRIRKVLLALAHENLNLVTLQHNRGASVTKPSVQEARDVFAARRVVETGIAAELARRITPEQLAGLRRFVAHEHEAEKTRDRRGAIKLAGEFHMELAKLMQNEPLTVFLRALISRTSLIVAIYEAPGNAMCSHEEHGILIDRLAAHDAAGAVRYMEEHLLRLEGGLDLNAAKRRPVDLQDVFARLAGSAKGR